MSIRPLSKELQEKANNELNEDSNRIQDDLKHVRDWLAKQSYLIVRNEDQWLLSFLRSAKFSLERVKAKLDVYYTMRSIAPEVCNDRDPFLPEIQDILRRGIMTVVMDPSKPTLPAVLVVQWKKTDPEKVTLINILKTLMMSLDIVTNEYDNVVISGLHLLEDLEGMSLGYLPYITLPICKVFAMILQDVSLIRLKGIHFINGALHFEAAINLVRTLMKDKMKKRFNVYGGDGKGIHKHIPLSILPKEYGGEAGSLDELSAKWRKKVESYRDWFLDDAQYYTNEAMRPGKPKLSENVFGSDGSFRKLSID